MQWFSPNIQPLVWIEISRQWESRFWPNLSFILILVIYCHMVILMEDKFYTYIPHVIINVYIDECIIIIIFFL